MDVSPRSSTVVFSVALQVLVSNKLDVKAFSLCAEQQQ